VKLLRRLKAEAEEESVIEEANSDDEDELPLSEMHCEQSAKFEESREKPEMEEALKEGVSKQERDAIFEAYKKTMAELNRPCMLYSDVPLPYNKRAVRPPHNCRHCGGKVGLEAQITERVLSMGRDPQLLYMDWGSVLLFTCVASCDRGTEECVEVQFEVDAVTEDDLRKLKRSQKNKKKKQKRRMKSQSKEPTASEKQ
jgi:hypothetical protein